MQNSDRGRMCSPAPWGLRLLLRVSRPWVRRCEEWERGAEGGVVDVVAVCAEAAIRADEVRTLQDDEDSVIRGEVERARPGSSASRNGETGNQSRREVDVRELPEHAQGDIDDVVRRAASVGQTDLADLQIVRIRIQSEAEDIGHQRSAQQVLAGVREVGGQKQRCAVRGRGNAQSLQQTGSGGDGISGAVVVTGSERIRNETRPANLVIRGNPGVESVLHRAGNEHGVEYRLSHAFELHVRIVDIRSAYGAPNIVDVAAVLEEARAKRADRNGDDDVGCVEAGEGVDPAEAVSTHRAAGQRAER